MYALAIQMSKRPEQVPIKFRENIMTICNKIDMIGMTVLTALMELKTPYI
jgi:hypothetical protein